MLICFIGAKTCGKSTAAHHLVKHHGFTHVSVAKGLKDMLAAIGLTDAQLYGDEKETPTEKLCGKTPRHAMQTLGTNWGRNLIDRDLWIPHAKKAIQLALADGKNVVVDDARFANETAVITELGGTIIRVRRKAAEDVADKHESEMHWRYLPFDKQIHNEGTSDDLGKLLDKELNLHAAAQHSPKTLKTGPKARQLIQKWEGIEDGDPSTVNLDPYLCPAGYWTIGWGHVVRDEKGQMLHGRLKKSKAYSVYPGGITKDEAEALLTADLVTYERYVRKYVTAPVTPGQFGAMVSLCYNIGPENFRKSSVVKHHNAGRPQQAADSFLLWNKARVNGKLTVLKGLTNRRREERELYLEHTP